MHNVISSYKNRHNFQIKLNKTKFYLFFFLLAALIFSSCQTTNITDKSTGTPENNEIELCSETQNAEWTEIEKGFWKTQYKIDSFGVSWLCVKIDLDTENLQLLSEPKNSNSFKRFSLKKFAEKNQTIAAVNTTQFSLKGFTAAPVGVIKADGKLISSCVDKYSALTFEKNEENKLRAKILVHQTEDEIEKMDFAFGGFFTILENDTIFSFAQIRNARTACGIDEEGRLLYLFCVTPDSIFSKQKGLTYEECAFILQKLGCKKAMQFDGGTSSALCIYTEEKSVPAFQRKIPAVMGFNCKK